MNKEKDFFKTCFNTVAGLEVKNESQAIAKEVVLNEIKVLEQQCKKQKEVIDKAIELLGNYKHYSTPDEKQNSDNEDLVNNAFNTLKEVLE